MEVVMKKYLLLAGLLMPVCAKSNFWSAVTSSVSYVYQSGASLLNAVNPLGWDDVVEPAPVVPEKITVSQEKSEVKPNKESKEVQPKKKLTKEQEEARDYERVLKQLANQMTERVKTPIIPGDQALHQVFLKELSQHLVDSRHEKIERVKGINIAESNRRIHSFRSKRDEFTSERSISHPDEPITFDNSFSCFMCSTSLGQVVTVGLFAEDVNYNYTISEDTNGSIVLRDRFPDAENSNLMSIGKEKFFATLRNTLIKKGILCPNFQYTHTIELDGRIKFRHEEQQRWDRRRISFYEEFPELRDKQMSNPDIRSLCKKEYTLIICADVSDEDELDENVSTILYNENYEKIDLNKNSFFRDLIRFYLYKEGFVTSPAVSEAVSNHTRLIFDCPFIDNLPSAVELTWHAKCVSDAKIELINLLTEKSEFISTQSPVTSLVLKHGTLIVGHVDGTITFWNVDDRMRLRILSSGSKEKVLVGLSSKGELCYSADSKKWCELKGWATDIKVDMKLSNSLVREQNYLVAEQDTQKYQVAQQDTQIIAEQDTQKYQVAQQDTQIIEELDTQINDRKNQVNNYKMWAENLVQKVKLFAPPAVALSLCAAYLMMSARAK
jgi:hypothetical protein